MKEIAENITLNVSHAVEMSAAMIISIALLRVITNLARSGYSKLQPRSNQQIRIQFGSSVAIALELLLGADVLATAVAPTWNDIGKLAAIAIIRTTLNYFLGKELLHVTSMREV